MADFFRRILTSLGDLLEARTDMEPDFEEHADEACALTQPSDREVCEAMEWQFPTNLTQRILKEFPR